MKNIGLKVWLPLGIAACLLATAGSGLARQQPDAVPNIKAVDPAGLKAAVSAQKGKVVLVNLWATWCGPCVEEFPDIVKLYNAYKKDGLVVIAVSVDEPEDAPKVIEFIAGQKAGFPVLTRKGTTSVEKFIDQLDPTWRGAVPATYIYNKQGKLTGKAMYGSQPYEAFEAAVKPHLK